MSRVLIDTQALIWFAQDASVLSQRARLVVDDPLTVRLASVASIWEMAIKIPLGKLTLKSGSLPPCLKPIKLNCCPCRLTTRCVSPTCRRVRSAARWASTR